MRTRPVSTRSCGMLTGGFEAIDGEQEAPTGASAASATVQHGIIAIGKSRGEGTQEAAERKCTKRTGCTKGPGQLALVRRVKDSKEG